MHSAYANVCSVRSTREEVVLLFGLSQTLSTAGAEVTVKLSDRIVISPLAAKRLAQALGVLVTEYERRFGSLEI